MAEFGVHGVEYEEGTTIVIGRCYKDTLSVGDTFQLVTLLGPRGDELESYPVNLTIQRMVAYRQELDEVYEGLTAEIRLTGEGGEQIIPLAVLRTTK